MSLKFQKLFLDIRFYILILFILRLYGITDAPLESSHSWRQCFTNMVTRNFFENGIDFLYPTIDVGGNKTGIVPAEFPFLNFLTSILDYLFGFTHWHGRLINLIVSSFGVFYYFKLIREFLSNKVAIFSSIILLCSIWLAFSRKIMPDTFSVSLVIIGLYYAYKYIQFSKVYQLTLFLVFCTLGMLSKIPSLCIFATITAVFFYPRINLRTKLILFSTSVFILLIVFTWYFIWNPYLVSEYGFQLYIPKSLSDGWKENLEIIDLVFKRFYFDAFHSFVGLSFFLLGIYFIFKNKAFALLKVSSISIILFILFILKTGNVFGLHSYYIIPIVPIMALIAGYGLSNIPPKTAYFLVFVFAIEATANQIHDLKIKSSQLPLLSLEKKMNQISEPEDLIVTSGGRTYINMYYAHRKGWVAYSNNILRKEFTDSLSTLGAKYLLIKKSEMDYPHTFYPKIYNDDNFAVYDLNSPNN